MMQSGSGIVAMFGPQAPATASHIQSISDNFHIPHVETRFDYNLVQRPYSINIHPKPAVLGKVEIWKNYSLLYSKIYSPSFFAGFLELH